MAIIITNSSVYAVEESSYDVVEYVCDELDVTPSVAEYIIKHKLKWRVTDEDDIEPVSLDVLDVTQCE